MINGKEPDGSMFEAAMRRYVKQVQNNPNLVILHDLESGQPYVATKAYQQALIDLWESCKPKFSWEGKNGKIIYFGTKGEI